MPKKKYAPKQITVKSRYHVPDGDVLTTKYRSHVFTSEHVKIFSNTQYKLAMIDKATCLFYLFICEQMDASNNIVHTHVLRSQFIAHAKKNLNMDYKDDTLKKSFSKLVKVGLIINYDKRSDFTVNPRHAFKGNETERKEFMQMLIYDCNKLKSTKSNYKMALGLIDKNGRDLTSHFFEL
jgi:hypothetical protein